MSEKKAEPVKCPICFNTEERTLLVMRWPNGWVDIKCPGCGYDSDFDEHDEREQDERCDE